MILSDGLWRSSLRRRPRRRRPRRSAWIGWRMRSSACYLPSFGASSRHGGPPGVALRSRGIPGRAARQPGRPRDEPRGPAAARHKPAEGAGRDRGPCPSGWRATFRTRTARFAPRRRRSSGTSRATCAARCSCSGLRRHGAGDRVSQRGQPAGRARALPTARAGDHERARGVALAARDGGCSWRACCSRAWAGCSGLGLAQGAATGLVALAPAGTPRIVDAAALDRARTRLLAAGDARDRRSLRPAACVQRPPRAARGGAADRRPRAFVARGTALARPLLVTSQMALALVLVLAATLVVRSMVRLQSVSLGFETERVVAVRVKLPQSTIPTPRRRLAFFEELERRLSARPGVEAVAFANELPLRGGWGTGVEVEGRTRRTSGRRRGCPGDQPRLLPGARDSAPGGPGPGGRRPRRRAVRALGQRGLRAAVRAWRERARQAFLGAAARGPG